MIPSWLAAQPASAFNHIGLAGLDLAQHLQIFQCPIRILSVRLGVIFTR